MITQPERKRKIAHYGKGYARSALDDVLAKNYLRRVSTSPAPLDLDHQKQRLAGMRAVFPDLVVTSDKLIAEGDFVALHATVRGTPQRVSEYRSNRQIGGCPGT